MGMVKYSEKVSCDKQDLELPGRYGCDKRHCEKKKKKSRKYKKYYYKKKSYQKYPRYKKRRYFRKRKPERKYCPTGSTSCRCWLYNEEGHYANNCPNRKEKGKGDTKETPKKYEKGFEKNMKRR